MTKKIDVFKAAEKLKSVLNKILPIKYLDIYFHTNEKDEKSIGVNIFYIKDKSEGNTTIDIYDFNSNLSFEEVTIECRSKLEKIALDSFTTMTTE